MAQEKRRPECDLGSGVQDDQNDNLDLKSSRRNSGDKTACADCGAPLTSDESGWPRLRHDETCPAALAAERAAALDREWFAEHPDAIERYRPLQAAERGELAAFDVPRRHRRGGGWVVHVHQVAADTSTRIFLWRGHAVGAIVDSADLGRWVA